MTTHHNLSSKQEKSHIRDNQFTQFHRLLNKDHYMQDLDHTLWTLSKTGNDGIEIVGFLEEKHFNIRDLNLNSWQFRVLAKVANETPAFCLIKYYPEEIVPDDEMHFTFFLLAANQPAQQFLASLNVKDGVYLSEKDYYNFECQLRKEKPKQDILKNLNTKKCKFRLPNITKL